MKFKYVLIFFVLFVVILLLVFFIVFVIGGVSGVKVDYQVQGKIGEVVMNFYDIVLLIVVNCCYL